MPWIISKRGDQYCVVKQGQSDPVPGGCHTDRADAIKHQRALYANEPKVASMEIPATVTITPQDGTVVFNHTEGTVGVVRNRNLVAATAPLKPPLTWFEMPEPNEPTPMTYEDSGQVYGHLALWNSCHRGFMGGAFTECVKPPASTTNYSQFELGSIETAEGTEVPIGKITFDTDHARIDVGLAAASKHYDNTGSVGAYVKARNGKLGIWLSGALRSNLAPADVQTLRANPLSGDWRSLNHNLELVASLAVPVPGFPIARRDLALAASANGEVISLILAAPTDEELEEEETLVASYTRAQILKKRMLKSRVASLTTPVYEDGFTAAVFTAQERRTLAKSGAAMPDGSFPIRNCSDWDNARHAVGRAAPGKRAAVEAHIAKRGRALGCSAN